MAADLGEFGEDGREAPPGGSEMLGTTAPPQRAGAQESGASSGRPVAEAVAGGAVEGSGCGVERRRRGRSGHTAVASEGAAPQGSGG